MTPERKLIEAVLDALGETIFPNDSQATRILATPAVQTALAEVRGQGARPQDHWTTVGAIKAARALIKTANDLCFAAETSGGTAGRDAALCAAIDKWAADRDKQKQVLRIIELEGHEPEVGVGYELCPIPPATARAEAAEERVSELTAQLAEARESERAATEREAQAKLDGVRAGIEASMQECLHTGRSARRNNAAWCMINIGNLDAEAIAKEATRAAALSDLIAGDAHLIDTVADSDGDDGA